jgi:hypothetical protein
MTNLATDFHRADPEPQAFVHEVPAVGTYVVRDGDIYQEDDLLRLLDSMAAANRRGALDPELWGAWVVWMEASR